MKQKNDLSRLTATQLIAYKKDQQKRLQQKYRDERRARRALLVPTPILKDKVEEPDPTPVSFDHWDKKETRGRKAKPLKPIKKVCMTHADFQRLSPDGIIKAFAKGIRFTAPYRKHTPEPPEKPQESISICPTQRDWPFLENPTEGQEGSVSGQ